MRDPEDLTSLPKFQPMPDLDPEKYESLKKGIEEDGVLKAVDIDEEGKILDGHHRVEMCRELEEPVPVTVHEGLTEAEKLSKAWSLNMQRRNVEEVEKQDLIEKRLKQLDDQDITMTNEAVARELGVDPTWVGEVRKRLVDRGKIGSGQEVSNLPQAEKREAVKEHLKKYPNKSNRGIAEDLGVSHPTVGNVRAEGEREEIEYDQDMKGVRMFPYVGSKSSVARWLVSKFPPHKTYVEVFGGGASVLYTKPPNPTEVYNDKDEHLVHLIETIRDEPGEMDFFLEDADYTGEQYDTWTRHWYEGWRPDNDAERAAVLFFGRFAQVRAKYGEKSGFAFPHNNPDNKAEYNEARDRLSEFSDRLDGVQTENLDFEDVLAKYDSEDTLFYIDPPYVGKEEYHGDIDHERLVDSLTNLEGDFILSYGETPPDGLDSYRSVKVTGIPGDRADVEHHFFSYPKDVEGEFVFGREEWMEAGDAMESDW